MYWKEYYIGKELTVYDISEYGDIRNRITNKVLKPYKHKSGYLYIDIYHKKKRYTMKIHRMVAETYMPVRYKEEEIVNHEDGIKTNNHYTNLKWCTYAYNTRHAYDTGLLKQKKGTLNHKSKYSRKLILEACQMISDDLPLVTISEELGMSVSVLQHIRKRRIHSDLSKDFIFPEVYPGKRANKSNKVQRLGKARQPH